MYLTFVGRRYRMGQCSGPMHTYFNLSTGLQSIPPHPAMRATHSWGKCARIQQSFLVRNLPIGK
jgi:hypothetical protein